MRRNSSKFFSGENFRFLVLGGLFVFFFGAVLVRLFFLQVLAGEELQASAQEKRSSSTQVLAKRGNIVVYDSKTNNEVKLAVNTTLYKVFLDAREEQGIQKKNFVAVAQALTQVLYSKEEYMKCLDDKYACPEGSIVETKDDRGEVIYTGLPSFEEARSVFNKNLLNKMNEERTFITYATKVEDSTLESLIALELQGLIISKENKTVSVDLTILNDLSRKKIAQSLSQYFGGDSETIEKKLYISRRGYIPVLSRVDPEKIDALNELKSQARKDYLLELGIYTKRKKRGDENVPLPDNPLYQGLGFEPEPLRYYPEGSLAANIIGFVNHTGEGQYGIEKFFEDSLRGKNGYIAASRDIHGNAITIEKNNSESVVDGVDIILTIDRIIQKKMENLIDQKVDEFKADSGQIIIMNPQNGDIIAMANSTRFNPNFFGDVYARKKITPEDYDSIYKTTSIEKKDPEGNYVSVKYDDFVEQWAELENPEFYTFVNRLGPAAYTNKVTMEIYEPGSVIKSLIMAAALEEGEVLPDSRYFESKPLEIGESTIRNADNQYLGSQTMTNIIERSANLGMVFIAEKMGKKLMYTALSRFGFGEFSNISLPDELAGTLQYYTKWSRVQNMNASFGQGFSATPLQVITSWTSLANGGFLVSPHIVKYIRHADGRLEKPNREKKRILSVSTIRAMNTILISSVEKGVAKAARMDNHYIAGKTGTSQITKINGTGYEDLDELGSTITGFIGYAPVDDPQFLVLVKFDRPRKGINGRQVFGSSTASPTFKEVMQYLFYYYDTPADK